MTLSVAMIVKNESKNLRRCLDSVKGLADELVIVDTGSTDDTISIATEYEAKVIIAEWTEDFARARNIALDACSCDWILTLDADETVSDHNAVRASMNSVLDAIVFPVRNYFSTSFAILFDRLMVKNDGQHYSEYPHFAEFPAMRMFKNHRGFRYTGRIHEQLCSANGEPIRDSEQTGAIIHHFGKVDLERELKKRDHYFNLAKKQTEEDPGNPQAWFNLMAQSSVAMDSASTISAALKYLDIVDIPHVVVLSTLAMAYQAEERHAEALRCLVQALEQEPDHLLSMCRFPISLCMMDRVDDALEVCKHIVSVYPMVPSAHIIHAECNMFNGDMDKALAILDRSIVICGMDESLVERRKTLLTMMEQK
jgi:uncharacterized protein YceK